MCADAAMIMLEGCSETKWVMEGGIACGRQTGAGGAKAAETAAAGEP